LLYSFINYKYLYSTFSSLLLPRRAPSLSTAKETVSSAIRTHFKCDQYTSNNHSIEYYM